MIQKTISIVDSDKNFCAIASNLVEGSNLFVVNKIYCDRETALKKLLREPPDIIITDLDIEGEHRMDFILKLKEKAPQIKILIITNSEDHQIALRAINQGASGYLYKKNCNKELLESLTSISNGGAPIDPFVTSHLIRSIQINRCSPLSNRETTILRHMIKGKTSTGIANDLVISQQTVRSHVKNIYRKLQVNSREQALKKAVADRLIVGHLDLFFQ
jgi:DNA-binding NarL/FixJ family response regulator